MTVKDSNGIVSMACNSSRHNVDLNRATDDTLISRKRRSGISSLLMGRVLRFLSTILSD
jgi:hypothetical protein